MSKIRINDLARELEVKSRAILDVLTIVGVTEKKTHSSSVEDHEADKVRAHFRKAGDSPNASKAQRASRADGDEIKTKIDLSNISKPGDVLNLLRNQQNQAAAPAPPPAAPARPAIAAPPVQSKPVAAPPAARPVIPAAAPPAP
jgi:translation initiation factor IF-2